MINTLLILQCDWIPIGFQEDEVSASSNLTSPFPGMMSSSTFVEMCLSKWWPHRRSLFDNRWPHRRSSSALHENPEYLPKFWDGNINLCILSKVMARMATRGKHTTCEKIPIYYLDCLLVLVNLMFSDWAQGSKEANGNQIKFFEFFTLKQE